MRPGAAVLLGMTLAVGSWGCRGRHQGPGEIVGGSVPERVISARAERQTEASRSLGARHPEAVETERATKQILFGDLHVHTTFSLDAFNRALPFVQGEGLHPPADACDFARYCSALDFWSINDHAEGLVPEHWRETRESIRQCNAVAGDPRDPDVVAFLGWEWSQVGRTPEEHYGHKNVIFIDTEEGRVPTRPISARSRLFSDALLRRAPLRRRLAPLLFDFPNRQIYLDIGRFLQENRDVPLCAEGVDTRQLPPTCHEVALTPDVLFEKLAQWGFDSIVIPHGTTWGLFAPPATSFDKQLRGSYHDDGRQTLFEIYSGHGSAEEYRDWRAVEPDEGGGLRCPEPTEEYLPCCWRAGEIIRSRCDDPASEECERRVRDARRNYVEARNRGWLTVPGTTVEDWLDCGQCRTCFNPSFRYRPGTSAQYALAISSFDRPSDPRRFRFGFIASSDNHTARPGTGYKEYARQMMTETAGPRSPAWQERMLGTLPGPATESIPPSEIPVTNFYYLTHFERQTSFFMTGGLVAAHSSGRDRRSIWDSLKRREVYGTSGDRILLWFDLVDPEGGSISMGSEAEVAGTPRFRVRAVGALEQLPGCPDYSLDALGPARLERLCRGECYNPGDRRRLITRIEIVRIRPQIRPDERVADLVEDPWRRVDCAPDPTGCVAEFEDPGFGDGGREVIYYARAIQEPTPAVNAGGLRCEYDAQGRCVRVRPCYGDYRTPYEDDCLSPNEERAWSSPIWVRPTESDRVAGPAPDAGGEG